MEDSEADPQKRVRSQVEQGAAGEFRIDKAVAGVQTVFNAAVDAQLGMDMPDAADLPVEDALLQLVLGLDQSSSRLGG
jgi:hypothetical protein